MKANDIKLEDEIYNDAKTTLRNICDETKPITIDVNILTVYVKNNHDKLDTYNKLQDTIKKCDKINNSIKQFIEISNTVSFMSDVCPSNRITALFELCKINIAKLTNWSDRIDFQLLTVEDYCGIETHTKKPSYDDVD